MSDSALHGTHQQVLQQVQNWLGDENLSDVWLSTVVKTYGSSPRPVGSMMAYHSKKGIVGSLSGGCIEEELIQRLNSDKQFQQSTFPQNIIYGESAEQQTRLALPCGGQLEIVLEKLNQQHLAHIKKLNHQLNLHDSFWRQLNLISGEMAVLQQTAQPEPEKDHFYQQLSPAYKLLLVGAGEVTRCVAELAQKVNFAVTLCDYREQFLQGWQVDGVEVVRQMPDDLIEQRFSDKYSAVVALAHDPRIDDMAMMQALTSDAFYIGAMGSQRTSQARRLRLAELEVNAQQLTKLHAPIGLDIRSKTPYEIAFSIISHLISERSKQVGSETCQKQAYCC